MYDLGINTARRHHTCQRMLPKFLLSLPTRMSLEQAIEDAIISAWVNAPPIIKPASTEPNHVARFIHSCPYPIAEAIVAESSAAAAKVRGTFCHQNPYVFWESAGVIVRCELADLLLIVRTPAQSRALLVQTKMGLPDTNLTPPWGPGCTLSINGKASVQRDLYASLPDFYLELGPPFSNRPTAQMIRSVGGSIAAYSAKSGVQPIPYKLNTLPISVPAGLIYAGIDKSDPRTAAVAPWSPWLTEPKRPASGDYKISLLSTLSKTLTDLVEKPSSNAGLPIHYPSCPDWERLISDLQTWANEWFSKEDYHETMHGVTLDPNEYVRTVFDNTQSIDVEGILSWHVACSSYTKNHKAHKSLLQSILGGYFNPSGAIVIPSPPRVGNTSLGEGEDYSGGFGMLEIDLLFRE